MIIRSLYSEVTHAFFISNGHRILMLDHVTICTTTPDQRYPPSFAVKSISSWLEGFVPELAITPILHTYILYGRIYLRRSKPILISP